jgi:diguanylate cyclase (GGDEF)-like protein
VNVAAIPVAARGAVLGTVLPRRLRLLLSLLVVVAYAVAFVPLYALTGEAALMVFCLVTAAAGGMLGVRGGLFVALVGLLLHALPFGVLQAVDPTLVQPATAAIYVLAVIASALGFGLMEDWRERVRQYISLGDNGGASLRTAISQLPVFLFTVDRKGALATTAGRGLARLDRNAAGPATRSLAERWPDRPEIEAYARRALAGETVNVTLEVGAMPFDATFAPLRNTAGVVEGAVAIGLDATDQRQARRENDEAGQRDALTGLPNRTGLMRRLDQALPQGGRETALLLLDLDGFKHVNEAIGHKAGDELLRALGERVFAKVGVRDQLARLGGDEFAIISPGTDERAAAVLARTISESVCAPFTIDGRELFVTASIGVAMAPQHGTDAATLMRGAELAMYDAKRRSVPWTLYAPAPVDASSGLLPLSADLRRAIENGELALVFQPIVTVGTGKVQRFEALARWPRRDQEISPSEFVPLAERLGLLTALTDWVITASIRQLRTWIIAGRETRVTVNLSARNLLEPDLPRRVAAALAAADVPADRFGIEVTETTIMADPERASRTIAELRALGVAIALDDFGTGHSSLAYLHRLPITIVKIDKSFVRDLAKDENGRAIVRATVGLAHALGFTVVAEGVEDQNTLAIVRELGCDEVQGFHIARPLQPADALRFLRD